MSTTVATWCANVEAFRALLKVARLLSRTEWDHQFVEDIRKRFDASADPMQMALSDRQMMQLCRIADAVVPLRRRPHQLWSDADKDAPDSVCDPHGSVVLALCKVCGQAEAELQPNCPGPRSAK